MDDVNKKLKIRKRLDEVVFKTSPKCNTATEEKKSKSVYETLKRKINVVKTIEDKIRDDKHMTSMKIAQFLGVPTALVCLSSKFKILPLPFSCTLDVQFQTNSLCIPFCGSHSF